MGSCRQSGVTHGAFCLLPEREYYSDYRLGSSHACAAPRSGAAGAVGDARLVSSTHNPPSLPIDIHPDRPPCPVYRVVVHDFGGGYIEAVIVRESRRLSAPSSSRRRSSRTRDEMSPEDLRRSVSRARKSMRHKVLMMGADRMLTLTYRANQCDLSLAYSHLSAFVRLCRRKWGRFDFVAVPEFQARGAVHFHIALNRYYPVRPLRRFWLSVVGSLGGNIDMTSPRTGGQWSRQRLCNYLGKYMSKSLDVQDVGRKRYTSSRGIPSPSKTVFFVPIHERSDTFRHILSFLEFFSGSSLRAPRSVSGHLFPVWYISSY